MHIQVLMMKIHCSTYVVPSSQATCLYFLRHSFLHWTLPLDLYHKVRTHQFLVIVGCVGESCLLKKLVRMIAERSNVTEIISDKHDVFSCSPLTIRILTHSGPEMSLQINHREYSLSLIKCVTCCFLLFCSVICCFHHRCAASCCAASEHCNTLFQHNFSCSHC